MENKYFYFIFIFMNLFIISNSQNLDALRSQIGTKFADNTAEHIRKALIPLVKSITRHNNIQQEFETIKTKNDFTFKQNNVKNINDQFVAGIEKIFNSKTKLLHNIKNKAEFAKKRYKENPDIPNFNYLNIRNEKEIQNQSVAILPTFSNIVPINLTKSFVQIPTNIYSGDKDVLNTATWTQQLDEVFKDNHFNQSDSTLLYQYYGDASGFFRVYPGNLNGLTTGADLYDCRRRIWYSQASSSAKDVVIMIDLSGSMIGNNIGIAKIAAASLIDTLQENDYFNIITINKEPKFIHEGAKYLIQATKENKEVMKQLLQEIEKPNDITDIDKGLEEAFNILESSPSFNRTSADCNKAIMIITDGIEGSYAGKAVFEKRNPKKTVRAFSFLVGRIKNPSKDALIEMSCNNRGYFYAIQTLGNVWDTVLDYLNVFSRPMTREEEIPNLTPNYSPMYLDSTGLGMITSVSLGVFHRTEDMNKFIGVVGTDISIYSLEEQIPSHQLGVFSRSFVINNNGFVFMHPNFRHQTGYLPAPPNILIEHIEQAVSNGTIDLKIAMLTPEDDSMQDISFETYSVYDAGRKLTIVNGQYVYKHINNTEYTAATVIMDSDLNYFDINDETANLWLMDGINALYEEQMNTTGTNFTASNWTTIHISPWEFCKFQPKGENHETPKYMKHYPTANELYTYLIDKNVNKASDIPFECDKELLKRLLVTAAIVNKHLVYGSWKESVLMNKKVPVETLFVLTNTGYSRYLTNNNITKELSIDVLKTGIFELASALPTKSVIASAPWKHLKDGNAHEHSYILLAGTTRLKIDDKQDILTTVSGMNVSTSIFFELLLNATKAQQTGALNEIYFDCHKDGANDTLVCAIIDYSGYIISSNQGNKYTGRFFGEILGPLIKHLVEKEIFTKTILNDAQAICDILDEHDSASNILLTPFKLIFTLFTIIFQTTSWFVMNLVIFIISILNSENTVKSQTRPTVQVSCVKEMPFYTFNEQKWKDEGHKLARDLPCEGVGNQQYAMQTIDGTNLIFLIANVKVPACRTRVTLDHIKKEGDTLSDYSQTFRRKPKMCFNATSVDDGVLCGHGNIQTSSIIVLFTMCTISILFQYLL